MDLDLTPDSSVPRAPGCPQCGSQVAPGARFCGNCGVDLTFAALIAERIVLARFPGESTAPLAAEAIFPRVGEYLLQKGVITQSQLESALIHQAGQSAGDEHQTLGQILIRLRILSRETLDQALTQMIQDLQGALLENNRKLEQRVFDRTRALRGALDKLAEINELKVNFMANISHELRTPLATIKGYAALLAEGQLGDLSPDQDRALGATNRAIDRLERLIEDLLQFTQVSRGVMALNREPVSVAELCAGLLESSRVKSQRKAVRVETDVSNVLLKVYADRDKLNWVLFQLLDNAIKFTPAGGEAKLSFRPHGGSVRLSVRDTGIGIPADRMPEIFAPFHQLDSSTTRRFSGTGLGLALVSRMVEAHGASLEVESQENQGSTFSFDLPQA